MWFSACNSAGFGRHRVFDLHIKRIRYEVGQEGFVAFAWPPKTLVTYFSNAMRYETRSRFLSAYFGNEGENI